jgi:hypothetical protein
MDDDDLRYQLEIVRAKLIDCEEKLDRVLYHLSDMHTLTITLGRELQLLRGAVSKV